MEHTILAIVDTLGYAGIALLMVLELVFPPIPSEVVLPFAGSAAAEGTLSLWGVLAAAVAGSVLGGALIYGLGKLIREEHVHGFLEKHGRKIGVSSKDMRAAEKWFDRHGARAVLFGRLVPGVRSVISLPAGMRKMSFFTFMTMSFLGAAFWSTVLVVAGYALGSQYDRVEQYMEVITNVAIFAIAGAFGWFIWRRFDIRRKEKQASEKAE